MTVPLSREIFGNISKKNFLKILLNLNNAKFSITFLYLHMIFGYGEPLITHYSNLYTHN